MSQATPRPAGDARAEILARVRSALADRPSPAPVGRDYRTAGAGSPSLAADAPRQASLDLLSRRLVDYHALVRRVRLDTATGDGAVTSGAGADGADWVDAGKAGGGNAIAAAVAAALADRGVRRLVRPPGLPPGWLAGAAGVEAVDDEPALTAGELDAADGVLTGCALAIAETGTIILDGGPGQGRRALSLVPDYHLVVVRADQVVAGVPDAIARLVTTGAAARPQTWVSGPSATSDIELNRVEGVHGPRTLEVILVS
ncbi:LutC/YkgG family protein [Frankia nepalensis]|uniref:LUD domain-containing protein n=1 Tax=Frankia nepalensis TaxID=1836974 RepID=A0A937RHU0_9ACTN|nr:LUD domain-containing protein [Frankia nepalensis]MBL7501865.1 LUD domain-containing protein [Frankia nepalensis]MBL7513799.1 LUD domain-containing protein [Frankia nepalensis]MBL7629104.1 LUD domain-containing protein [Frankia nepalensis]